MLIVGAQVALADPAPITFAGGDGSAEHPYEISNATQLKNFGRIYQDFPDDWQNTYRDKCYKLTANITLTGTNNYVPAGTSNASDGISHFGGTFDGQGFYISGISVNEARRYVGFVALNQGTIKNLTIKNSTFCSTHDVNPFYVGAIAAQSSSHNSILACVVDNCTIRGTNNQANSHVGGIVGIIALYPTIQNCVVNNCTISSGANDANSGIGGIIGQSTNASNNNVIIQNCCVKGTTSINGEGSAEIGAIIGKRGDWANVNNMSENYYEWTVQKNSTSVPYNGTGWGIGWIVGVGGAKDTEYAQIEPVNSWAALKRAMSVGVTGDGVITLADNCTDPDKTSSSYLAVPQNKTVVLNLNGKTINRNLTTAIENGYVIYNRGTLTINGSGTITGGKNTGAGGGIYDYGTLTINGGSITGNTALKGGGIFEYYRTATVTINGASITNNSATDEGGGIHMQLSYSSNVTICGGSTISNNSAVNKGGGIYYVEGTLKIKGKVTISGNTKGEDPNNVDLSSGKRITIDDNLDSETRIGVYSGTINAFPRYITSGLSSKGVYSYFTSDDATYAVRPYDDNNAEACLKRIITPTVSMSGWTYGSTASNPQVSNKPSSVAVTYTYKAEGESEFTSTKPTNAGTHTVKATTAETSAYTAGEATTTYTVAKKSITITPNDGQSKVYGTNNPVLTYTATALASGDSWTGALGRTSGENVGNYSINQGTLAPTNSTNYTINFINTKQFAITQKSVTISGITASNKTYDGSTSATLVYTNATFTGKVGSDDLSVSATGQFASKDVGTGKTVTISALVLAGASAGNYTIESSSQSTTTANITKAPLTITGVTASNKTYDGSTTAIVDGTGATISGLITGDDVTCTYTGEFNNANVGTGKAVTINVLISGGASAGNYEVASCNSPTANITPKPLTVTAKDKTITYGDAPANDGVTYSGFITGEDENTAGVLSGTLAYTYSYAQYGDVGSYTITPSGLTSNNYAITFESGTLTVQQKALTIKAKDQAITYGTTIAKGTDQVTAEGLVTGDVLTAVKLTPSASDYTTNGTITPSDATTQKGIGNYSVTYTDGALTIGKAVLTVTAKDKTITYGDAPANDGVTYNGFITGEDENTAGVLSGTLAYTYSYAQYGDVGSYTITPSGLTSNNYAITFESGTLTVQQKALTITAKDQAITYGTTIATGTGQVTAEGLVTGDVLTAVKLTPSASDYTTNGTITPSDATTQKGIGNYSVTYTDGALTIGKAVLTVTAKDKTITYGDAPANDGVTYSGFVTGEDENTVGVLGGTLAYTYSYAQYGDVGNAYTITPSGLTSSNYAITFTPGTLTVEPKEVGLEWSTTTTFEYDGEEHAPTATATDLINGDEVGVTVTGAQTDACEEGYVANATALTGDKSGNYKLPTDVSQNFIINRKEVGITWGHTLLTYNGSAQAPMAQATGLVGADECNLTVDGGQTAVGAYTATVTGMTGSSKDNYKLPTTGLSTDYEIVNPLSISFAANQTWATWYGDYDYEVPEGTMAYTVSSVNGSTVTVDGITYVPANMGVLIKRETTGTATVANSNVYYEETCDYTSLLKSGDPTPYQDYILYGNEFVLSSVSAIGEHRCYLPGTGAASARRLTIEMGEAPTGISPRTVGETDSGEWYDLQGRRIGKPQGKGLYIHDGKKVVIK